MKFKILNLLALVTLMVASGCSDKPVAPTDDQLTSNHGGYTATDEAPAFGDARLLASAGAEASYPDPLVGSPMLDSLINLSRIHAYHFRAVWGHLVCDSTEDVVTNWDGSLEVSRGVAVLRRTIQFEPSTDSILARTDWGKIEWASSTSPCFDGVVADLVIPPSALVIDTTYIVNDSGDTTGVTIDTMPSEPATLSFVTGPYSHVFTEVELAKLDTIIILPDGNTIAFAAFPIYEILCPRGSLMGEWTYTVEDQGTFSGTWRDNHGFLTGFVEGHFEINADSEHVFFGKWIDATGKFEGFLEGRWRERHYGVGHGGGMHRFGWFNGNVLTADNTVIGRVKAKFTAGESDDAGFFHGRWKVRCLDDGPDENDNDDGMDRDDD